MNSARRSTALSWDKLGRDLDGRFTAQARGLLVPRFVLLGPDRREFGRLEPRGAARAELRLWRDEVTIEASGGRYRMVSRDDGEEMLTVTAQGDSANGFAVSSRGGRSYRARVDLLCNRAVALDEEGTEVTRLSGGSFGRSYRAVFDVEDRCALPIAVFLLWLATTNRRRAYRREGTLLRGGVM